MPVKKSVTTTKKTVILKPQAEESLANASRSADKLRDPSLVTQDDKKTTKKTGSLSVPVYSLLGKAAGTLDLPKEVFGVEVNKKLLAQALRVYMSNQKTQPGSTKSRGEINATKAKVWRQKGTGRARHGARSAPIFVGGGVAFGPKPRNISLELPKKMKHLALLSALSSKVLDQGVVGVSGLDKASGKTKEMASFMAAAFDNKKTGSVLMVINEKQDKVLNAVKNLARVDILPTSQLNAYEILKHHTLILSKEAVDSLGSKKEVA